MSKPDYEQTLDSISGAHSEQVKLSRALSALRKLAAEVRRLSEELGELRDLGTGRKPL